MTTPDKPEQETIPTPFEDVLMGIYAGRLEPRSHEADVWHKHAVWTVINRAYAGHSADGMRVYQTRQMNSTLEGNDITYSLMMEKEGRLDLKRHIGQRVITLSINGNLHQPAALIVPAPSLEHSAAIVVGDHMNEAEHIESVGDILTRLRNYCNNAAVHTLVES